MPHRKKIIHLMRTENGLELTQPHIEHYHKYLTESKHHLRIDYKHLHLKHKIDISTIDFDGHANINQKIRSLILIRRAIKYINSLICHILRKSK